MWFKIWRGVALWKERWTARKRWGDLDRTAHRSFMEYKRGRNPTHLAEAIASYREALGLRPPGRSLRSRTLYNLATSLELRYRQDGELEDLSSAIAYFEEALTLRPPGHSRRDVTLNNLASALRSRSEREGDVESLSRAISYYEEALDIRPSRHRQRDYSLNNLGNALQIRHDREGNLDDLARAVACHQEALELRPLGHPYRYYSLDNLANALRTRYDREGNFEDLIRATAYHQEALDLHPSGHPCRVQSLTSLAVTLRARYAREGDWDSIVRAISYLQEALDLRPSDHPHRDSALNSLGIAFRSRYEREGDADDLARAIAYHQEALNLRPAGHIHRVSALENMALAVWLRYEKEGNPEDLTLTISHNQEVLVLLPPNDPFRDSSLNSLAIAFWARYIRDHVSDDLAQAIAYFREALHLVPAEHPRRDSYLSNLATAFWTRYEKCKALEDLTTAIACYQQAIELQGPEHPLRTITLRGLAQQLYVQYKTVESVHRDSDAAVNDLSAGETRRVPKYEGLDPTTSTIIPLLREASHSEKCYPRDRLQAALDWIRISRDIGPDSTLEAYTYALHLLDMVLTLSRSLDARHNRLLSDDVVSVARIQDLGGAAATCALQHGKFEQAVELLDQGRSLLLAQIGRYRIELDDLRKLDSKLADRFTELSRSLDALVLSEQNLAEAGSMVNDPYGRYRTAAAEWDQIVNQIRTLPGFDGFLKPVAYGLLRKAAADGPIIILIPNEEYSTALIVQEHSSIHCVHLPLANWERLAQLAHAFTQVLKLENVDARRIDWMCAENLRVLWTEVVGPIAWALQHDLGIPLSSRIWWCPTSVTTFLPLHAAGLFSREEPEKDFTKLYVSSYTPSLQALLRARGHITANVPKKLLIISQPNTPGEPSLSHAMAEADVIAETVSPDREVTTLSAEAGTCKAVLREMASHSWIHFICHGIQKEHQPLDSYLALHDGHLTLREIIKQDLPHADLAFLSACHSATGDNDLMNEALHIASAMQFAGFRGVVGTLWAMKDDDGPLLAEAFYREMITCGDSRNAAIALHEAVKHLRRNKVPINRWIRFIHIGI